MSAEKKYSVLDKKYEWPNPEMANGSLHATGSSQLIALSIKKLGEVIHDFAKMIEHNLKDPQQTENP